MAGWNLWVWLQYIGVASRCCCKEVYRYPHNNYFPYSTCIRSFFASSILTSLFIFKMFFRSCFRNFFTIYSKRYSYIEHSRSFKKSRSREYKNYLIISVIKNVERASTARARESRDIHVRGTESGPNDV